MWTELIDKLVNSEGLNYVPGAPASFITYHLSAVCSEALNTRGQSLYPGQGEFPGGSRTPKFAFVLTSSLESLSRFLKTPK